MCAQAGQNAAALNAHGLRHGQNGGVAPGCGNKGQGDPRIAAGGFHDGSTGLQQAFFLGIKNKRRACAAFYGIGRVAAFHFGQHSGLGAGHPVKLDERRVAIAESPLDSAGGRLLLVHDITVAHELKTRVEPEKRRMLQHAFKIGRGKRYFKESCNECAIASLIVVTDRQRA